MRIRRGIGRVRRWARRESRRAFRFRKEIGRGKWLGAPLCCRRISAMVRSGDRRRFLANGAYPRGSRGVRRRIVLVICFQWDIRYCEGKPINVRNPVNSSDGDKMEGRRESKGAILTSAKFFHEIPRAKAADITTAKSSQQPNARTKPFQPRGNQMLQLISLAAEQNRDQSPPSLSQLMNDMNTIYGKHVTSCA